MLGEIDNKVYNNITDEILKSKLSKGNKLVWSKEVYLYMVLYDGLKFQYIVYFTKPRDGFMLLG